MGTCSSCGQGNPAGFRFCGACGSPLADAPGRPAGEERKVVTVLFCDLVGFTARSDRADPEDVGAMLRPFHARLRAEIERVGGTLGKLIGDAVIAVFGALAVHEDDPERAVRCGLRMLDAIAELNRAHPSLEGRRRFVDARALLAPCTPSRSWPRRTRPACNAVPTGRGSWRRDGRRS